MDRAYWISWYDLPEDGRDEHLVWAHDAYIPAVLKRPGVLWAAHYASEPASNYTPLGGGGRISHKKNPEGVPTGDRFIMVVAAAEPHVLANPAPGAFHASLAENDRRMLAQRIEERVNIMIEEARLEGPEAHAFEPGTTPGPCIQLGSFNAGSYAAEEELMTWYAQWRLPSLKNLPGCIRVRKLVSIAGWAKHACFYEFTSLRARQDHFVYYEHDQPDMVQWSTHVVRDTVHAPGSANVAVRLWPPIEPR